MRRQDVLKALETNRAELQAMGVKSLQLFGSLARDEARDSSDVDLLVEFDRPVGLLHFAGVEEYIESLLGGVKVDLVLKRALREEFRQQVFQEAINAL